MNKLLTVTAAVILGGAAAFAADIPAQVQNKINIVKTNLDKATPGTQYHAELSARYAALTALPETFDQFVETATSAYEKAGGDPAKLPAIIDSLALWDSGDKYLKEGWAYSKKNGLNSPHWVLYAGRVGMTEAEELDGLTKLFLRASDFDTWIYKSKMQRFMGLLNSKPEAEAKALLKQINRVVSPKLVTNKDKWEPVVVLIRTALETY